MDPLTGYIYPLYEQTYTIFIDPQPENTSPITVPSADDGTVQFFQTGLDVGDYGSINLNAHTVTSNTITKPFYTLVKLPSYLIPDDSQLGTPYSSCPSPAFEYCVSSSELHYLLVKGMYNSSYFYPNIKDYPISISQSDSLFYSYIYEDGLLTGIIEHNISAAFKWQ